MMVTLCHYSGKETSSVSLTIMPQSVNLKYSCAPYIDIGLKHKIVLRDFHKKHFNKTKNSKDWKLFQNFRNITKAEKHKKENLLLSN